MGDKLSLTRQQLGAFLQSDPEAIRTFERLFQKAQQFSTAYGVGSLLVGGTDGNVVSLDDVAVGNVLLSGGVGALPVYGKVDLTVHVAGILPVANGGTGLSGGTSGGVLGFTGPGTLASSGVLTNHALVIGNGPAATPSTPVPLGTTSQVLHGNAVGNPSWGAVALTTEVSGILPVLNGGTGLSGGTSGGILGYTAAGTLASSTLLTNHALVIGAGSGATPSTPVGLGTTTQVLHGNAAGDPSWGSVSLTADVSGILPLANGGTNANLTASNGGIFYSTGAAGAILAGTATAGQILLSGASAAPSWSTATYPAAAGSAANVLRSNGTNFLSAALAAADLSNGVTGSGAVVLAASPTFTGTVTQPNLTSAYVWSAWNPSDLIGTITNAPNTAAASLTATGYTTLANAAGTLTITFSKAGSYLIDLTGNMTHTTAYTVSRFTVALGGTATRYYSPATITDAGLPNFDSVHGASFLVSATAGQTLTLLPKLELSAGAGTTANHTAFCEVAATYVGT